MPRKHSSSSPRKRQTWQRGLLHNIANDFRHIGFLSTTQRMCGETEMDALGRKALPSRELTYPYISYLGKRKIINSKVRSKEDIQDMSVPRRVNGKMIYASRCRCYRKPPHGWQLTFRNLSTIFLSEPRYESIHTLEKRNPVANPAKRYVSTIFNNASLIHSQKLTNKSSICII